MRSQTSTTPASARKLVRWGLAHLGVILAVLWGACTLSFIALKLNPGDPVAILMGGENIVGEAERPHHPSRTRRQWYSPLGSVGPASAASG